MEGMRALLFLLPGAFCGGPAWGDVTLRYRFELQASGASAAQLKELLPGELMPGVSYGFKDDGRQFMRAMEVVVLTAADGVETLHFPALKIDTKPGAAAGGEEKRQMEEIGKALKEASPGIDSKVTGRTKKIAGIECAERMVLLKMGSTGEDLSMPVWLPSARESERVPALRKLMAMQRGSQARFDPLAGVLKAFGGDPQSAAKMATLFQEFQKLESAFEFRIRMAESGGIEIVATVDRLSEDTIPEVLFEVPADYRLVAAPELEKALQEAAKSGPPWVR
jgi:hypothetical protein